MLLCCVTGSAAAQDSVRSLEQGFKDPPGSAKPRTWWHWTSGNVTKEGITKDLEWMKRVGIGGMHLADVAAGGGQSVEKKIIFGSPEWLDAIRHAASEADRLVLEMSIFSSPGWSETGGPWVKPEQAMKKLVWSETNVAGHRRNRETAPLKGAVAGFAARAARGSAAGPRAQTVGLTSAGPSAWSAISQPKLCFWVTGWTKTIAGRGLLLFLPKD